MSSSAPSLKAPLPVDRSLLPKVYDPTQNKQMFTYMEDQILNIARKASTVGTEEYIKLPKEQKELISTIQAAVEAEDTKELLRLLPDTVQAVLDYEKMFPGGLTNNSFWTTKYMDFIFDDDAEPIVTGADAEPIVPVNSMQTNYDLVKTNNPDMPEITNIAKYDTQEQALEEAEADTWVQVGIQFMKTPKSNEIKSSTLTAMSDSELSKALMPIMKKWDEENPEPSGRARVGHSRKREKYYIEQRKLVQESQAQAADVSDATGSIVDTDQEAFDKAIQKLVAERLVTIPDGDPNDIATMVAYKVRRTNPKYKDLKPSKIEKD
jgi:hypothetical protein